MSQRKTNTVGFLLYAESKNIIINTDTRLAVARGRGWEVGKMYEGGQKYKLPILR